MEVLMRTIDPEALMITGACPDLSGINAFTIIIREDNDPERQPRHLSAQYGRVWRAWKRKLKETSLKEIAEEIMTHLEDGVARTFNCISVEMLDKTADITFDTKFEDALWLLVIQKQVEYSQNAPILFRKRGSFAWDPSEEKCHAGG
jgi:hypothetical protein